MSFNEDDLTFYDTSEWSDDGETNDDDYDDRLMYQSDYEINENYSLEESIDIPEDSLYETDNERNFIFHFLSDEKNSVDFSLLPELKQFNFIKNGTCLKLELKENNLVKLKSQAISNLMRINESLLCSQNQAITCIITNTNKNHFIINQMYSPLLYAVSINSLDLVYDLLVHLKCDPNVTHGCNLTHSRGYQSIPPPNFLSADELMREREAVEESDDNSTEIHFYSPLMLAVKKCNFKICELLLSHNADVNCLYANDRKSCGYPSISSISLSINNNNLDILKLLIKYNANINERLWFVGTPFSHMYTYLLTAKKMCFECETPNCIIEKLAELYDYLVRHNELEVTNGDFYIIFKDLAYLKYTSSKPNNVFIFKSMIVLLKCLSIMNLKHIEKLNAWLTKIISKIIFLCYEKDNFENLMEVSKCVKFGGLMNPLELKSLIFAELDDFDNNNDEFLTKFLNDFKIEPLSLKQICRLKVKTSLKYFTKHEIFRLNLPNSLKNYLYFLD